MSEKVIRDNKVAVLYSTGFGAGWSTWNTKEDRVNILLFHPKLVDMVESGKQDEITEEWCEKELGIKDVYCGGSSDLKIEWLDKGASFYVEQYDGSEQIITQTNLQHIA